MRLFKWWVKNKNNKENPKYTSKIAIREGSLPKFPEELQHIVNLYMQKEKKVQAINELRAYGKKLREKHGNDLDSLESKALEIAAWFGFSFSMPFNNESKIKNWEGIKNLVKSNKNLLLSESNNVNREEFLRFSGKLGEFASPITFIPAFRDVKNALLRN